MPIFEYRCDDCGSAFEAFVTGERVAACPSMSGPKSGQASLGAGMVGGGERREQPFRNRPSRRGAAAPAAPAGEVALPDVN